MTEREREREEGRWRGRGGDEWKDREGQKIRRSERYRRKEGVTKTGKVKGDMNRDGERKSKKQGEEREEEQ